MQSQWDIIVIGAGPSGMSAANMAVKIGLQVLLVDEQASPGGQVYKNITGKDSKKRFNNDEFREGSSIVREFFDNTGICYCPDTVVWFIEKGRVLCSMDGERREFKGQYIVVATGAMERPVPFKGWTLPGVMTAGSADLLHKSAGILPKGPVIIAGNGPLLEKIQMNLHELGVDICAVAEMSTISQQLKSLFHLPKALGDLPFLVKGGIMKKENILSKVKRFKHVKEMEAKGEGSFDKAVFFIKGGEQCHLPGKTLLYHHGVIPRTHITRTLQVEHAWNEGQRYWYPKTDIYGKTNVQGIYVVGDGAFVHGAAASSCKGKLTALDIAFQMGCISMQERRKFEKSILVNLKKSLCTRDFIDGWFAPDKHLYEMEDSVLVCRCEGVTAGEIRNAVSEGCLDPNDIKIRTRCGMGPCQGRMCGPALSEIAAQSLGISLGSMAPLKPRTPIRPMPFGEICGTETQYLKN